MKAMIFAAGMGTRLMPMTKDCPKALIPVEGKPMLKWIIERLAKLGIQHLVINTHHQSGMIWDFLRQNRNFGLNIDISDESTLLLDTGGGLSKASHFLSGNEPILIHNVDIFSDINIPGMLEWHKKVGATVTLAVRKRDTKRYLLFDGSKRLAGWEDTGSGEKIIVIERDHTERIAFSGIHIIEPEFLKALPSSGVFSLINTYLKKAKDYPIFGYEHNYGSWIDAGKTETLRHASEFVRTHSTLYT